MLWYDHLYMGEKAKKHRFSIIQNIRRKKYRPGIYVITPASNENNILDIYPVMVLSQEYYAKKELLILGIAQGYQESLEVAARIVSELYERTGSFQLWELIGRDGRKV